MIILLWLSLARSETFTFPNQGNKFYCDDNVGICLHNNLNLVRSWEDAQTQCAKNNQILLEIYDGNYKIVVKRAFNHFGLYGWYVMLGLEYRNEQFRWLTGKFTYAI